MIKNEILWYPIKPLSKLKETNGIHPNEVKVKVSPRWLGFAKITQFIKESGCEK